MTKKIAPKVEYEKYTLPNGLQVILHIDRKLPIVHINHWFHVGSKVEQPGRTGFAHLFEHLMFEGSKHAPGGYFKYIEQAGGNLREGGVNGTTSYDRTNYFSTVPSGNLKHVLWLESDRIATLPDALTSENFENQREVVRNERRQTMENQPYGRWLSLINEHLYPAGHPYVWPIIGSHEDLEAATIEEVTDFFKMYYTPNNLSLVVAGDFDIDHARAEIERFYGELPAGPLLDRRTRWIPDLSEEKIVEVADRVPQARAHLIWPAPARFENDESKLDIAAVVLGDGLSSRLKKKLVYERQMCTDVYTFNIANEITGMFAVVATIRPNSSLTEVETLIKDEIEQLAANGPSQDEMERTKTTWEYQYVSGLERIGGFGGKADRLNESNTYTGDPGFFHVEYDRFEHITTEDVQKAAEHWLTTRQGLMLRYYPEAPQSVQTPTLDRSQIPALGADTVFQPPVVQSGTLDNGLEVMVVERHDLPKVAVSFDLKAGSIQTLGNKAGTAQMMMLAIDKGTQDLNTMDIAEGLSRLGTTLQGSIFLESATLSMDVLSQHLPAAMSLFSDIVRNPLFPEDEIERERNRHLDGLAQRESYPQMLATRICPRLIFGTQHPYGLSSQGYTSTIPNISRADVVQYYDEYWKPADASLTLVGQITLEEAMQQCRDHFGSWTGGPPSERLEPISEHPKANILYLVDRPESPQTIVCQFFTAPKRTTPDYYALRLIDTIWGGGFQSRLNQNLREEKGYTYGISSAMILYSTSGYWKVQTAIQADKTGEVVRELIAELQGLAGERPITETELTEAKTNRIRGYAQQFETLRRITSIIGGLWSANLPLSEIQDTVSNIAGTTLEEVHAAARRHLKPEQAAFLLVGDRSQIEPQLAEHGLSPAVILDQEGNTI